MYGMDFKMIISCSIFIIAYIFIITDKIDRTVVALSGASLMIVFGILNQENAFKEVDYNTLGLLIGMMIIVMITKRTGIFEYLAIKIVKVAKGKPTMILFMMALITGAFSSVLDNVTTILLIIPLTFNIAKDLHINPVPFIISEVFASNIGGTATLIGDPPNIMIGSSANLSFMDFIVNDARIVVPLLFLTTYIFTLLYKKKIISTPEARAKVMEMDEKKEIKDLKLLKKSMFVIMLTILGFVFHGVLHYESATVAILGAVVLLLISGIKPEKILREVEWNTILFFTGLFILVGGIKETGVIQILAQSVMNITHGNPFLTVMTILWASAIASAFIDNIPFVATMMPMIKDIGNISGINIAPLWWALSLGACLGGNGTIIGASANVIATGIAEEHGHNISFKRYFKIAFPIMILTIFVCTVYLYLFYLI